MQQLRLGNCQLLVFLLPFRNNDCMKYLRKNGAELRLCDKRLKFGGSDDSAPFDSYVAIIKANNVY